MLTLSLPYWVGTLVTAGCACKIFYYEQSGLLTALNFWPAETLFAAVELCFVEGLQEDQTVSGTKQSRVPAWISGVSYSLSHLNTNSVTFSCCFTLFRRSLDPLKPFSSLPLFMRLLFGLAGVENWSLLGVGFGCLDKGFGSLRLR